jgi:hypothetical protein
MNWINLYGLIIIVLMLLPNMLYAYKNKSIENKCKNKAMNLLEQIGRYGSMFLMIFNIGLYEFGFRSKAAFVLWLISSFLLMLLYWAFWYFYFKSPQIFTSMMLAIIPSLIFISSGFFLRHWLLVIFGVTFSIGHIYVTYMNNKAE